MIWSGLVPVLNESRWLQKLSAAPGATGRSVLRLPVQDFHLRYRFRNTNSSGSKVATYTAGEINLRQLQAELYRLNKGR